MFRRQTLARRLILTILPWYLLLVLVVTVAQLAVRYVGAREDIAAELGALGETVAPGVADAVWQLDHAGLVRLMRGIRGHPSVSGVTIRDEGGGIIGRDPADPAAERRERAVVRAVPLRQGAPGLATRSVGQLELDAGNDVLWRRIRYDLLAKTLDTVVIGAGLWLIFVLVIHLRLSRSVTQLAAAVRKWEFKGTDTPIRALAYPYTDELGQLVGALGETQARLLASLEALGQVNQNLEHTVAERTEDLRLAKEAAESADRLKSAFLATMSHELRTPLNSIIGFTGILLQGLAGPMNDEQRKQLGMVRTSARHLLALINDVLDISKIEAGELEIARVPFDLADCVDKVMTIVRPMAGKKQLALDLDLPQGLDWAHMTGDPRRLEQVLINLLGNAVKFTDQGVVTLAIRPGRLAREGREEDAVLIDVHDTGIGIRPEHMDVLFKPFRQVDPTLSRQHEGTGLGLAICLRLVARMGGRIEARSRWGEGSTFTVCLPLVVPAPSAD